MTSQLEANPGVALPIRSIAAGLDAVLAQELRRAIIFEQRRAAVAARICWWDRWERDPAGFTLEHLFLTGYRDPHRLLAAILEREAFWTKER